MIVFCKNNVPACYEKMQTTVDLTVTSNNIPRFFEKEKKIPDTLIGFIWKYCNQFFITLCSICITLQLITSRKVKLRVIWWLQNSLDSITLYW